MTCDIPQDTELLLGPKVPLLISDMRREADDRSGSGKQHFRKSHHSNVKIAKWNRFDRTHAAENLLKVRQKLPLCFELIFMMTTYDASEDRTWAWNACRQPSHIISIATINSFVCLKFNPSCTHFTIRSTQKKLAFMITNDLCIERHFNFVRKGMKSSFVWFGNFGT